MFKKIASMTSLGSEPGTGLLRAARSGNLEKVLEFLNTVDINTSNANGLNALHLASKDGHIAVVKELLNRGADVNAATKKGNTSLHIAALAGQEEVVHLLIQHGANVNVQSQNGFTPLYMASQENHDSVVKFLLGNGANQALATEDGFTPLAVAMQQGHDKVVSLLLSHDSRGKARLPALHIAAKKNDLSAAGLLLQTTPTPDLTSKSNFTPLHIAAHYGNSQVATLLLDKGADVNFRAKHQITPLHVAAKWGKNNVAGLLIERGADVGGKTRDGLTPLHCAARSGHEALIEILIEKGAGIGAKTKNGLTPLHMSAQGDHVPSARILLFNKAPVDDVTVDYLTPLHVAAHCGHVRVAKLLLDKKADPNSRALNGFTPLHIACKKNRIKVVELLLQHGAGIEASTESGLTPLHVASFMGCMNIAIFLLQNGAEVEARTVRGETPLHLAARANQTDIVRILLRNGACVDSKAKEDQTPLHISARLGNSDLVMLLLQHGGSPDATTKEHLTAVHIAAKEGQEEVCSILLDNGAAPAPATSRGFTPLHLAAKNGHLGVAKLLLAKGAPVDAVGRNGLTPLHVATSHGHPQIATLLLDGGANPTAITKNGHTPLHIAAKKNRIDIGTKLIPSSDVNARSKAGFTPVHIAAMEGNLEFVKMLIRHGAETGLEAENNLTALHLAAQEDRVTVADSLTSSGVEIDPKTSSGYTPLHIASHFGHSSMVKFLLGHGADIGATTSTGNTPLHHAAQQGQAGVVSVLLEKGAQPNALNSNSQTPLSIASKLNYVSVVESLRRVTTKEAVVDKYKISLPETMIEGLASDSEDEGVDEPEAYRYLTVDDMKSLGDDSMPMDVEGALDEMEEVRATGAASELSMSQTVGKLHWRNFLVSFMVDARGGALRGCRHSGIRLVIPPGSAPAPTRVTCKYLRKERLAHPPPLMEGEGLVSRILELGPVGAKFLGKVTIEVPHFGGMRGGEREVVVLRSEDGVSWREHVSEVEGEAEKKELEASRLTRITTTDFPQYFALVSRIKQEVHAVGPEGGVVSSSVVKEVTATFPSGALTKRIRVGIQAHPISAALIAKHGSKLSVSPIVTVEPRRRKFHKPITLSIPLPPSKESSSTLRLLCSITGGSTRAQWEDVTGSTPLTFIQNTVSFTTTVSARFWLVDSKQAASELTRLATELYREAIVVPYMAKFLVYAKRIDPDEARLRVFCMTDDREEKTLEGLENFTEVAKSRDVEVLESKAQYLEMAGNLTPVTKSGEQLKLKFYAFRENRLGLLVRLRDSNAGGVGRIVFRREAKSSNSSDAPTVNLNITLPVDILPDEPGSLNPSLTSSPLPSHASSKHHSNFKSNLGYGGMMEIGGEICKADLRLSDVANLLGDDWGKLAGELGVGREDVSIIRNEYESPYQQATVMLRLWMQQSGDRATGNNLEKALNRIHREDIVQQCIGSLDKVTDLEEQIIAKNQLDSSSPPNDKNGDKMVKKVTKSTRVVSYDEEDLMKDSESLEELSSVGIGNEGNKNILSPMSTSYETEEIKYTPEEKDSTSQLQSSSIVPNNSQIVDGGIVSNNNEIQRLLVRTPENIVIQNWTLNDLSNVKVDDEIKDRLVHKDTYSPPEELISSAASQLISEIEARVEERLASQSSQDHSSNSNITPKSGSSNSKPSAIAGSSSTASFFTARDESFVSVKNGKNEKDRPKSSDSSTLCFTSISEYQTPGSLTESQSTLGEDPPENIINSTGQETPINNSTNSTPVYEPTGHRLSPTSTLNRDKSNFQIKENFTVELQQSLNFDVKQTTKDKRDEMKESSSKEELSLSFDAKQAKDKNKHDQLIERESSSKDELNLDLSSDVQQGTKKEKTKDKEHELKDSGNDKLNLNLSSDVKQAKDELKESFSKEELKLISDVKQAKDEIKETFSKEKLDLTSDVKQAKDELKESFSKEEISFNKSSDVKQAKDKNELKETFSKEKLDLISDVKQAKDELKETFSKEESKLISDVKQSKDKVELKDNFSKDEINLSIAFDVKQPKDKKDELKEELDLNSKGISCDIGTRSSLPVTLTSSTSGTTAACGVSQSESQSETRLSFSNQSDDRDFNNSQLGERLDFDKELASLDALKNNVADSLGLNTQSGQTLNLGSQLEERLDLLTSQSRPEDLMNQSEESLHFESRVLGLGQPDNDQDGNYFRTPLEDIEEEFYGSSSPKSSLETSGELAFNGDKFKRPASSSSSLTEFEKLESAVFEELGSTKVEELLSEIEEGHESQISEATEICEEEVQEVDWNDLMESTEDLQLSLTQDSSSKHH